MSDLIPVVPPPSGSGVWVAVATVLSAIISAALGFLGGRRGKDAAASKDEAEAVKISGDAWRALVAERRQLSEDLVMRLEKLEAQNKVCREEQQKALEDAHVARAEAAESQLRVLQLEAMVADLIGRLRDADLIETGDLFIPRSPPSTPVPR